MFGRDQPLFFSWSNVRALPQVDSQAKKPTLVGTQGLQIMLFRNGTVLLPSIALWKDLTEKLPPLASFHRILSSKLTTTLFPCKENRNLSTISISQSLNRLEKCRFQPPSSPVTSQTSATQSSIKHFAFECLPKI